MKKKLLLILSAICLVISLCLLGVGCNGADKNTVSVPTGIVYDQDGITWDVVKEARAYKIQIRFIVDEEVVEETEETVRKTSYSFYGFKEGDYEIRLCSLASSRTKNDSPWTSIIYFHKDYETGCVYSLINNDTEFEIKKVGIATGDVVFDDYYRGKPITTIAEGAFKNSGVVETITFGKNLVKVGAEAFYHCTKLTKVTIPDSVSYIGGAAFAGCKAMESFKIPLGVEIINESTFSNCTLLSSVELHDNITYIDSNAFIGSALTNVTIPDSVIYIGELSFAEMSTLKSVTIGKGLMTIGKRAFRNCDLSQGVTFAEDSSLYYIADLAFYGCVGLTSITLPEGLSIIGNQSFYNCTNLETVDLPDSVVRIGGYTFMNTKLSKEALTNGDNFVYVDDWVVYVNDSFCENLTEIKAEDFKTGTVGIADGIFSGLNDLEEVTLAKSIKYLGAYAFSQCEKLYRFSARNTNLVKVGACAFSDCELLDNLILNEGLKEIGEYAFYGCKSLKNNENNPQYIVPVTVERIGISAFEGTKLWETYDENGVIYAGNWVIGSVMLSANDVTVELIHDDTYEENNIKGIADYAFANHTTLTNVLHLSDVEYIGEGAFYNCVNLTTANINPYITEISPYTFYGCTNLYSINMPRTLTKIGRSAFFNCTKLSTVNLAQCRNLTEIGLFAFGYCENLSNVTFPDSLTSIGQYAFSGCKGFTEIVLTDSITEVGNEAFSLCANVTSVQLGQNLETIGVNAFYGCSKLTDVVFPASLKTIKNGAFADCTQLEVVTFDVETVNDENGETTRGIEYIGEYAFMNAKVYNLILPNTLKHVGNYAFYGCKKLKTVQISKDIDYIGPYILFGNDRLTIYTDALESKETWHGMFNSTYRPIVWGVQFAKDDFGTDYVYNIVFYGDTITNTRPNVTVLEPHKDGYLCIGFTTTEGSSTVEYTMQDLFIEGKIDGGTKLYTVWVEGIETEPDDPDDSTDKPDIDIPILWD